jgi:hypothetical protein
MSDLRSVGSVDILDETVGLHSARRICCSPPLMRRTTTTRAVIEDVNRARYVLKLAARLAALASLQCNCESKRTW